MAKKIKKQPRSGKKDNRGSTALQKDPIELNVPSKTEIVGDVVEKKKACPHFDKGIDLAMLTSKISSAEIIRCEDCKVTVTEKKANKGKNKQGKKKGESKSQSKAIWVCLECGRFYCGGIGFPTVPQSHAVQHAKRTHHQLFIQYENLRLRWCFPCDTLIPVVKNNASGESNDPLSDIVKVIKGRLTEKASVNVEDVWFGTGSILNEIKSEDTSSPIDVTSGYVVRGLSNLGNTCFFNSIMQNLLALNRLREHYLELNDSIGPLTVSLKKIFIETISGSGLKNVINPRSFFGCVCAKAPQFKGFQQHDSHELLRCLLDGLCTEESNAKKRISRDNGTSANQELTFVDAIFGGQLSSTVSCLDCGHSSKVFEPFLDLSLPVPTKRPSSKRANNPISRAKKQKLPPKRNVRNRPKVSKIVGPLEYKDSAVQQPEGAVDDPVGQNVVTEMKNTGSSNHMSIDETEKKQFLESVTDDSSWLDYLEPDFVSNDIDTTSTCNDILEFHDREEKDDGQINESVKTVVDSCNQILEGSVTMNDLSEKLSSLGIVESCEVVDDQSIVSKVDDLVHEDEINQSVFDTQLIRAEPSCSSGNTFDNEQPLQVQGSEVILLPFKEESCSNGEILQGEGEVSSSVIGCEPDFSGFDGFGDLFNEPETVEGPSIKPHSSESDPDEVDNSNSPVSVESCLAYFTKPELLSSLEHGWNCENCSKAVFEQKKQSKKIHLKGVEKIEENGVDDRANASQSRSGPDTSPPSENPSTSNRNITKDIASSGVDEDANSEKIDQTLEANNFQESIVGSIQFPCEATVSAIIGGASSAHEFTMAVCSSDEVQQNESNMLAEGSESEENDGEEMKSESVKVKRDATKKILINKAPPILTIHLKRFCQDARGRLSKLNGHVDFKETIDLRPYMDPQCKEMDEYTYSLSGVVEHSGTMRGGHYVSYVRGSKKSRGGDNSAWYYASDAHVRQVSLQEVLNCEAYILFYDKI